MTYPDLIIAQTIMVTLLAWGMVVVVSWLLCRILK